MTDKPKPPLAYAPAKQTDERKGAKWLLVRGKRVVGYVQREPSGAWGGWASRKPGPIERAQSRRTLLRKMAGHV